jgi:hypothetical protein
MELNRRTMSGSRRNGTWCRRWLLIGTLICWGVSAAPPVISKIEKYNTNQLLIHFDTEANFTYELQATTVLRNTNGTPSTWTNVYVAPNLPFPNHYIVVDTRNAPRKFYRLHVTP